MGIHGRPTAVIAFGENEGAIGYLVGEANRGLGYMLTMMNHARINVGLEGVAISERAYQQALGYARERVQSRPIGATSGPPVAIIQHADVRRMLMNMKARIEAMRALAYFTAAQMDKAHSHPDAAERERCPAMTDLLTPVVKGWCTENALDVTSTGIQVHGGVGFIEETGACQHMRDARITTIYEGTTGIQANDLVGRKVVREQGVTVTRLLGEMNDTVAALEAAEGAELQVIACSLRGGHNGAADGIRVAACDIRSRPGQCGSRRGALPQAIRHRRGRLAHGSRGVGGCREAGDPRSRLLPGQADHGTLLR